MQQRLVVVVVAVQMLMKKKLQVRALVAQPDDIAVLHQGPEVEALQNDMVDTADKEALVAGIHMVDEVDEDTDHVDGAA